MQAKRILFHVAVIIIAACFFLFGLLILIEGINAFFFDTAEYHFGSESMVGVGGWAYRSRTNYLLSALALAVPALAGAGFISNGVYKPRKKALLLGLSAILFLAIEMWLRLCQY